MPAVEAHVAAFTDKDFDEILRERIKAGGKGKPVHPERIRYRAALLSKYAPGFVREELSSASDLAHLPDQPTDLPDLTPSIARGLLQAMKLGYLSGEHRLAWVSIATIWAAVVTTARQK